MKGANCVTELFGDVEHLGHLVGPVAMVMHQDVAAENFRQCLETKIASRRISFVSCVPGVPFSAVTLCLNPGGAVPGNIPHACGRPARLIHAFWIFSASHF